MVTKTPKFLLEGQKTDRLIFRKLEPDDFDSWLPFFEHPDSTKYLLKFANSNPLDQCKEWFDRVFMRYNNGLGGFNVVIDKRDGTFIGMGGLQVQTVDDIPEMEVGYSIMPEQRGKGYATEAAKKMPGFCL